jgi:hypothetical protein
MISIRKICLILLTLLAAVLAAIAFHWVYLTALLGSGYMAESLCSGLFVSGRDRESIFAEELSGPGYELLRLFQADIDEQRKQVTGSTFGLWPRTAIYRDGLGCTLAIGKTEAELREEAANLFTPTEPPDQNALWPEGERVELERLPGHIDRNLWQPASTRSSTNPILAILAAPARLLSSTKDGSSANAMPQASARPRRCSVGR